MLWVYGHYKYVDSYSAGIDFRRRNLTSKNVRFWRVKTVPALQGWDIELMLAGCWASVIDGGQALGDGTVSAGK